MVGTGQGRLRKRGLTLLLRLLAKLFFRRVEVVGSENVPREGGGLLVAWHPNGLADGILVLGACPRQVTFGARHGLFRIPLVGWLLRGVGAVPLYRARDSGEPGAFASDRKRRAANHRSLAALAAAARQSFVAIFPEGATHDEPQLLNLRAGAARLFELARQHGGSPALVPVGLHYERKNRFRSRALVVFHPPVELPPDLCAECDPALAAESDGASEGGTFVERLTGVIEQVLIDVTYPTESWKLHRAMERVRSLVRAERAARAGVARLGPAPMHERDLGFARVWVGYRKQREVDPRAADRLVARVTRYGEALGALRLNDRDLDGVSAVRLAMRFALLSAEVLLMLVLVPTVVLIGNLINLPTALLVKAAAKRVSKTEKEQAGLKMLFGLVFFGTVWLAVSLAVGLTWQETLPGFDWRPDPLWIRVTGMFLLCAVSGLLGLRYHRFVGELVHGLRALWAGGFRTGTLARLRRQRSELYDRAIELSEGLDLPGETLPDDRISVERQGA